MTHTDHQMTRAKRTVADRIDLLKQTASKGNFAFLGALTAALEDHSPAVRGEAVLLVEEHRLTQFILQVEHHFKDKSAEVRRDAAECVGILHEGRKTPHLGLRALLRDRSPVVRAQAVDSLGTVRDGGALPEIARLLSDREPFVRSYAASTIGDLRGSQYMNKIRHVLKHEKNDLARVGLLEGLFLLGENAVLQKFLGLLESSDYHVRCSVANALEYMPLQNVEVKLAIAALSEASHAPLAVADGSTTSRVLKLLKRRARRVAQP